MKLEYTTIGYQEGSVRSGRVEGGPFQTDKSGKPAAYLVGRRGQETSSKCHLPGKKALRLNLKEGRKGVEKRSRNLSEREGRGGEGRKQIGGSTESIQIDRMWTPLLQSCLNPRVERGSYGKDKMKFAQVAGGVRAAQQEMTSKGFGSGSTSRNAVHSRRSNRTVYYRPKKAREGPQEGEEGADTWSIPDR